MAKKSITKATIQKGFQDYLLEEGKAPETVRILSNFLKITDDEFYEHFGSLKGIEESIWMSYYHRTLEIIQNDPEFDQMSGREKHLSFLYTFLELIKGDRSYILYRMDLRPSNPVPGFVLKTRSIIVNSDIEWVHPSEFIPEQGRNLTQSAYKNILWKHSLATIQFWTNDETGSAIDTDAFIEKSTRTLFDVGELPALDSILDLGKFLLQKIGLSKATA